MWSISFWLVALSQEEKWVHLQNMIRLKPRCTAIINELQAKQFTRCALYTMVMLWISIKADHTKVTQVDFCLFVQYNR